MMSVADYDSQREDRRSELSARDPEACGSFCSNETSNALNDSQDNISDNDEALFQQTFHDLKNLYTI